MLALLFWVRLCPGLWSRHYPWCSSQASVVLPPGQFLCFPYAFAECVLRVTRGCCAGQHGGAITKCRGKVLDGKITVTKFQYRNNTLGSNSLGEYIQVYPVVQLAFQPVLLLGSSLLSVVSWIDHACVMHFYKLRTIVTD